MAKDAVGNDLSTVAFTWPDGTVAMCYGKAIRVLSADLEHLGWYHVRIIRTGETRTVNGADIYEVSEP